jgi:hypothetical protein
VYDLQPQRAILRLQLRSVILLRSRLGSGLLLIGSWHCSLPFV